MTFASLSSAWALLPEGGPADGKDGACPPYPPIPAVPLGWYPVEQEGGLGPPDIDPWPPAPPAAAPGLNWPYCMLSLELVFACAKKPSMRPCRHATGVLDDCKHWETMVVRLPACFCPRHVLFDAPFCNTAVTQNTSIRLLSSTPTAAQPPKKVPVAGGCCTGCGPMQRTLTPLRCSQALQSHLAASFATCHTTRPTQPTSLLQQQRHRTHKMWHRCRDSNTVLLAQQLVLGQNRRQKEYSERPHMHAASSPQHTAERVQRRPHT